MSIYIFGYIGGALGICSLIPQLVKSWRSKKTRDLALGTYIILVVNYSLWLVHGLVNDDPALVITNSIAVLIPVGIVIAKLKYK